KANRLSDVLRDIYRRRAKKEVIGDEEFARTNHRSARCRMHPRIAEIWLTGRISGDVFAYSLKLSPADVLQILPFRRGRRRLVEEDRNLITLPDLRPHVARHRHTAVEREA